MEIRLLAQAPRILADGRPVALGSPKERLILTVLAHSAGKVVPTQTLIDIVWERRAPDSIRSSVHSYITRIRQALREAGRGDQLVCRSQGYVLDVEPMVVDLHRAKRMYQEGGKRLHAGEHALAADLLGQALDLWQGDPLAEVPGSWAKVIQDEFEKLRLKVLTRWAEAEVARGGYDAVLDRLADGCAKHPDNDPLVYVRMRALTAIGREAEAIECYEELRAIRREKQGTEPNERTRRLFQKILDGGERREPRPGAPSSLPARAALGAALGEAPPPAVRDNLEPDLRDFVTREAELGDIVARARAAIDTTVVQVIEGAPGVGKTSLALRAAHLIRDEFDARLHLRLRGADGPLEPEHAVYLLLCMLGVPGEHIPPEPEARVALWRNQLLRRRALILLDDATHDQVRLLVPGNPGCVVLVTSRNTLTDLDGAHHLTLRPLASGDSARMFAAFTRMPLDAQGATRLLSLLGGSPLALRLCAARLRKHPAWTPEYFADRIVRNGVTEVSVGGRGLASVFDLSYDDLDHEAWNVFLTLGLHPTAEISLHVVAAVVGDWELAERAMENLLNDHLVEEPEPGVYRMHDLLWDYARQRAATALSPSERHELERRILDFYLAAVETADRAAFSDGTTPERHVSHNLAVPAFATPREARQWFTATYPTVETVVGYARERGFDEHAARMPLAMAGLLDTSGPADRAERLLAAAIGSWRRLGRPAGLAQALYEHGRACRRLGDLDGALHSFNAAITEWEKTRNERGLAHARDQIGLIRYLSGDNSEALVHYRSALDQVRRLGDQRGAAIVLNHMGISQGQLGDHAAAIASFTKSMSLFRMLGDSRMEAHVLVNLTEIRFYRGQHREVREMCERCLVVFQECGDIRGVAQSKHNLGLLESYMHRDEEALVCFLEARTLFRELGDETEELSTDSDIAGSFLRLGRVSEAREILEAWLERVRTSSASTLVSPLFRGMGDVQLAQGRLSTARLHYRNARQEAANMKSGLQEGLALDRMGDLCLREEDEAGALVHWRQAIQVIGDVYTPHLETIRLKIEALLDAGIA